MAGMPFNPTKILGTVLLAVMAAQGNPVPQDGQTKPDNTKVNQSDKNSSEVTADSQKMNAADRALTAKLRRAVIADKSLSTYAHNIKIISQNGIVTLKGPVHSDEEVKSLTAKAADAAGGSDKVVNQLTVKQ
jgi:hyperosmotically inducible periplasmic protein